MPDVTGGNGSFGGSAAAGRSASNTGTGRSSAERAAQAGREAAGKYKSSPDGKVFTSTAGLSSGISVSPNKALQDRNRERMSIYNSAAGKWNNSAKQRSLENFVNHRSPMGFSMEPPDIARPNTFSEGDYHMGWNPGSLAGLASPVPGGGVLTGALGQALYSGVGGKNVMLGGSGDMGMPSWDAPGAGNPSSPGGSLTPGGGQLAGNTGSASPMQPQTQIAGPVQAPSLGLTPQPAPKPSVPQSYIFPPYNPQKVQIPGGNPYGVSIFGRAA